ncbi:MAG: hypothetical protein QOE57_322, partial [Acidimicrobiaceae bacterium]|nr:hypothetical protein [Acidimicrobiaceae bacterium]
MVAGSIPAGPTEKALQHKDCCWIG